MIHAFMKAFLKPFQRRVLKMQAHYHVVRQQRTDDAKIWETVKNKTSRELLQMFSDSSSDSDLYGVLQDFYEDSLGKTLESS